MTLRDDINEYREEQAMFDVKGALRSKAILSVLGMLAAYFFGYVAQHEPQTIAWIQAMTPDLLDSLAGPLVRWLVTDAQPWVMTALGATAIYGRVTAESQIKGLWR